MFEIKYPGIMSFWIFIWCKKNFMRKSLICVWTHDMSMAIACQVHLHQNIQNLSLRGRVLWEKGVSRPLEDKFSSETLVCRNELRHEVVRWRLTRLFLKCCVRYPSKYDGTTATTTFTIIMNIARPWNCSWSWTPICDHEIQKSINEEGSISTFPHRDTALTEHLHLRPIVRGRPSFLLWWRIWRVRDKVFE